MKLVSWNINGIRAVSRRGFAEWLSKESPDIFCGQEVKAQLDQVEGSLKRAPGYRSFWNCGDRRGYSGVVTFCKTEPSRVETSLGVPELDGEGRILLTEFPAFTLFNVYFPNGKSGAARLEYKLEFYDAFLSFIEGLRAGGQRLIVCGDFNTAHREIDLARPKPNEKISGFLPIERAWLDKLEGRGYVDTFRLFNQEAGQYTFWDLKTRARDRNIGWRIDYFWVTPDLVPFVSAAFIHDDVMGSDHCPIGIRIDVPA